MRSLCLKVFCFAVLYLPPGTLTTVCELAGKEFFVSAHWYLQVAGSSA
jgi:hypothetical protein